MPNYKRMYFELFDAVTAAIDQLQDAQRNGEEAYIESKDAPQIVLSKEADKKPEANE